jgi:hypothetical protein
MGFLLLGIDSLIACLAVAAIVDARWRLPLAATFGIADGVTFLIGAGLGWTLSARVTEVMEIGTLLVLGVYLIVVAAGTAGIAARCGVWVLPFALIFDNLAFGIADDSSRSVLSQATEQALSSALVAVVGLYVGVMLPRLVPAVRQRTVATRFAGGALLVAAGGLALLG